MVDFDIKKNIEEKTFVAEVESAGQQLADILVMIIEGSSNKSEEGLENELRNNEK